MFFELLLFLLFQPSHLNFIYFQETNSQFWRFYNQIVLTLCLHPTPNAAPNLTHTTSPSPGSLLASVCALPPALTPAYAFAPAPAPATASSHGPSTAPAPDSAPYPNPSLIHSCSFS